MGIVDNALMGASGQGGYFLTNSLRLRSAASAYLKRTLTGVSITKLSYSVWTKRGALGSDYNIQGSLNNAGNYFLLGFNSSDQLDFQLGGTANRRKTTQVFRDPSAWYHIYLVLDTTQATWSESASFSRAPPRTSAYPNPSVSLLDCQVG